MAEKCDLLPFQLYFLWRFESLMPKPRVVKLASCICKDCDGPEMRMRRPIVVEHLIFKFKWMNVQPDCQGRRLRPALGLIQLNFTCYLPAIILHDWFKLNLRVRHHIFVLPPGWARCLTTGLSHNIWWCYIACKIIAGYIPYYTYSRLHTILYSTCYIECYTTYDDAT